MIPVFSEDALETDALDAALRVHAGFFVRPCGGPESLARMLQASRSFFSMSPETKNAIAIERSPHFRGWSQMRNERDWREQLHLGRECRAAGDQPAFRRLEGPNLWPTDADWRAIVSRYIDASAHLGERILATVGRALGIDATHFGRIRRDGYLVAKLIGYHPQPSAGTARSGVAAHVDFSWLTINLQDAEGLEVRRPDGAWTPIDVDPSAVWVHVGELLEHATMGRYLATPHRVVNPSTTRTRVSIPAFINPPLDAWVPVFTNLRSRDPAPGSSRQDPGEHVHRVLPPATPREAFHFGHAEWLRKGLGCWCFACVQRKSTSWTSNSSVAFGGITPPAPRAP